MSDDQSDSKSAVDLAPLRTHLADGHEDGLKPLTALDLASVRTVDDLVRGMAHTSFGGRTLGEGADVLEAMVRDTDCMRVLTLSGAMTIAKQGLVISEMIDRGWVQAIVSTGALMTHGLVETSGRLHFKHDPRLSDEDLLERGYNRVYDTIELEKNLDDTELLMNHILDDVPDGVTLCSREVRCARPTSTTCRSTCPRSRTASSASTSRRTTIVGASTAGSRSPTTPFSTSIIFMSRSSRRTATASSRSAAACPGTGRSRWRRTSTS
jgi:hypothetical protein